MKTISSLLALVAFTVSARAGGIVDNTAEAAKIAAAASQLNGAGDYVFTNVKTGEILSFTRSDSTTDFFPSSASGSLAVQFADGAARLSGGNNKCASAQWSYEVEGGVDYAAVSYACAVGSGQLTGTATLEKTKQWWYIVPAGSTSSSSDDNNDDDEDDDSGVDVSVSVSFAAKNRVAAAKVASSSSSDDSSSSTTTSSAAAATSSSSSTDINARYAEVGYYETASSTVPMKGIDTSGVVSKDRKTWICRHPGWWLQNHPQYTVHHVECRSDLKAYRAAHASSRMTKRSRHQLFSRNLLSKKGTTTYNIISVDHINDMSTRAIDSTTLSTSGGYTSTTLSLWNASDEGQQWTITAA